MPWKNDADSLRMADLGVITSGRPIVVEERSQTASGKAEIWLSRKEPLRDNTGKIVGIIGVSIDITAQKEAERLRLENEAHKAIVAEQEKAKKRASQAVHDIGSPLSSLRNVVQFTKNMTEHERIAVITAMNSISDIANNLLNAYTNPELLDKKPQDMLVSAMLLQVVGNKRYEHKDSDVEFKVNFDLDANFSFIRTISSDFGRMISNLINNSVDALEGRSDKKIEIELSQNTTQVVIAIIDNGKGMPKELIENIESNAHKSYDKEGGHGVGWSQIYDTIQRNLGKFAIYSTIGKSTKVVLAFPKIRTPSWIAEEIKVIKDDVIVVVDDEPSIHMAWDTKLAPFIDKMSTLQIQHFSIGAEAVTFINNLSARDKKNICLLTDYELINQNLNGLDIVEQTGIKRSTLVTSHYTNLDIRERARKSRIKILPKELAFAVSIMLDKKIKAGSKKVDMVWVDDNLAWVEGLINDHYSTLKIDKYEEPISFLEDVASYPLNTKIILDMYYMDAGVFHLDGFDVAKQLHDMGYNNLYMAAGETIKVRIPDYLKVVYKDDVIGLSMLDKF